MRSYSCCAHKERLSPIVSLRLKQLRTFYPEEDGSCRCEVNIFQYQQKKHSHLSLPAKVPKLWPPEITSGSKLLDGVGGLCCTVVKGVWTLYLSVPLYRTDGQGNIFKELAWSLKTKRHVTRLWRAVRRSRIGSCAAIHPTNRGPVIRRGEQHDCSQWRNINKVPFSAGSLFPHRFGIWGHRMRWHCI